MSSPPVEGNVGMGGWIRLWRKTRENFLWRQDRRFSKFEAWLDLLMEAAYEDHEQLLGSRLVFVKRGQVLLSARKKALEWNWARDSVLAFFLLLESQQMIGREVVHGPKGGYTLLTVRNWSKYQGSAEDTDEDALGHGLGHELVHEPATQSSTNRPRTSPRKEEGKEGKEGKEVREPSPDSGLTLAQYLESFTPEGQEVLRQVVSAIASTRKSGKVAQSVLNALARKLQRYPNPVVLSACQIYLDKNYASEGKAEKYLLGIVRGEAKRQDGNGREPLSPVVGQKGRFPPTPAAPIFKTPGQLAIERVEAEMQRELERGR